MNDIVLVLAVQELYPDARENIDFMVEADSETMEQSFMFWDEARFPKPTKEQLDTAWLIAKEKMGTPEPTVEERLKSIEEANASITMEMVKKGIALDEANKKISALDSFNADLLMTLIEKEVI